MKITETKIGREYAVESDSGSTYRIRYVGSGDADPDYVSLWQCDCPAGSRRRECKHMRAFMAERGREIEQDELAREYAREREAL